MRKPSCGLFRPKDELRHSFFVFFNGQVAIHLKRFLNGRVAVMHHVLKRVLEPVRAQTRAFIVGDGIKMIVRDIPDRKAELRKERRDDGIPLDELLRPVLSRFLR